MEELGAQATLVRRYGASPLPDTILTRAASSYLMRFTYEAAVSGSTHQAQEAITATLDLIRSTLAQLDGGRREFDDQSLYYREAALDLIERHYRQAALSVESISRALHVSRRQLYRYFDQSEHSVGELINRRRVQAARDQLTANPSVSVGAIALGTGFSTPAALRYQFISRYGETPSAFRERMAAPSSAVDELTGSA